MFALISISDGNRTSAMVPLSVRDPSMTTPTASEPDVWMLAYGVTVPVACVSITLVDMVMSTPYEMVLVNAGW